MATRTTVQAGKWSVASTWDTGVPVDGDLYVLNHAVEFDANQSTMPNGMGAGTINANGRLWASTTAGAYYLKQKGNVTGSGTIQAGTDATTRYPANCDFEIFQNGAFGLDGQLLKLYCQAPSVMYANIIAPMDKVVVTAVAATPSPDCTGIYSYAGVRGGQPYFQRGSDNFYIWNSSGYWWLTTTLGVSGNGWLNDNGAVYGLAITWSAQGSATGQIRCTTPSRTIQSVSQSSLCTIGCTGHTLVAGNDIVLGNLGVSHPLNWLRVKVNTVIDANTFTVKWYDSSVAIDSTLFPAYTSGGICSPATACSTTDTTIHLASANGGACDVSSWGTGLVAFANVNRPTAALNLSRTIQTNGTTSLSFAVAPGVAFLAGSVVALLTRNIRITGSTAGTAGAIRSSLAGSQIDAEIRPTDAHGLYGCLASISGGSVFVPAARSACILGTISANSATIGGANYAFDSTAGAITASLLFGILRAFTTTADVVSSLIAACGTGAHSTTATLTNTAFRGCGTAISGGTVAGTGLVVAGCTSGPTGGVGTLTDCNLYGNATGISTGNYKLLRTKVLGSASNAGAGLTGANDCTFAGATYDLSGVVDAKLKNCILSSGTPHRYYNDRAYRLPTSYVESLNHGGVDGAFRSYALGGIVDKVSDVYPTGKTYSYRHACESATYPCFRQVTYSLMAGARLDVPWSLRKSVSMAVLPKVEILSLGEVVLAVATMTNSVDQWESGLLTYTNTSVGRMDVVVRVTAMNASGNVWSCAERVEDVAPAATDIRSGTSATRQGVAITGSAAIPAASHVRAGTAIDATTGTLAVPIAANVRLGSAVDATTGSLIVPARTDVRSGVGTDNTTGTAAIPAAADVRHGVAVDATTGTAYIPVAADVRDGVAVDATTGTYLPDYPDPAEVLDGVTFDNGNLAGTRDDAPVADVRSGVVYAAGTKTGTLPSTTITGTEDTLINPSVWAREWRLNIDFGPGETDGTISEIQLVGDVTMPVVKGGVCLRRRQGPFTWYGYRLSSPSPVSFSCIRAYGRTGLTATVKVYQADSLTVLATVAVTADGRAVRLPKMPAHRDWRINVEAEGSEGLESVALATSMSGLNLIEFMADQQGG